MALNEQQLEKAREYNAKMAGKRWNHAELLDDVLRGVPVDSAEFAQRVADLQGEEEIATDGKLGPRTVQAIIERRIEQEATTEKDAPQNMGWWTTGQPWPEAEALAAVTPPLNGESLDKYLFRMGCRHWSAYELTRVHRWERNVEPVREDWPNIVPTIRIAEILRHELGQNPLLTASGYRPRRYNKSIGGAKNSQHVHFRALLLTLESDEAAQESNQRKLYEIAARLFSRYGAALKMGLGFYTPGKGVRVSLDTGFGVRSWQGDYVKNVLKELDLPYPG